MNHKALTTEVVIVGAGPGGIAASCFLSKYGIHHVVLEKDRYPRDKVCGDACSGKTALVIKRANPLWLDEILSRSDAFLPSWGIRFVAPNGKPIDIPFHPNRQPDTQAPGFTVPRLVFDNFLFSKIASPYCTVIQDCRTDAITRHGGGITVAAEAEGRKFTVDATAIIGADGDKSLVRKTLFDGPTDDKAYAVGLRAYYGGITDLHPENYIELHFLKEVLPGYLWIFPLPNGMANVGVGILSDVVRKKKINLRAQMLAAIEHNPNICGRFKNAELVGKIQGWGLPLAPGKGQPPLSGDRLFLIGDAAHVVDPFSGEGIGNAMYSGMLAADAVKACMEKGDFSAGFIRTQYEAVFYKRLGQELAISAAMQRSSKYHWLFNFVINKAYKSPALKNTISCMFTDMDLRNELGKPSFYLKVLFNK
jgi:menaquinone-9 beta-reductase